MSKRVRTSDELSSHSSTSSSRNFVQSLQDDLRLVDRICEQAGDGFAARCSWCGVDFKGSKTNMIRHATYTGHLKNKPENGSSQPGYSSDDAARFKLLVVVHRRK